MSDKTYSCEIQVRWGDSDRLGHVNNVLYAEYAQEARTRFFRDCIIGAGASPTPMVVRRMEFDFLRPVTDATGPLTVEVSILRVGTSSFTVRNVMRDRHGAVCAAADGVLVGFDPKTEKSVPLSDRTRELLTQYVPAGATV
ncbi:acyl-CoA thioesterase [Rhodococcus sp. NPDC059234]|uniref:acyl-CoA thioesterase n=1 Tax=Rhodococcus sp. NPDC059234 TaxID=3346781 RepID=UPI00366CAA3B